MDLRLIESGNGGDLVKKPKDLEVISGFENMIYLALFGGNPGYSTPITRLENEQAFDWWGNSIFFPNNPGLQFNSFTENVLNTVSLTSSGRIQIENAVKSDLSFMNEFAGVTIDVSIPETDKVIISISVQEPDNIDERRFVYLWDATRLELS